MDESLDIYERTYESLGILPHKDGWFSIAGYIAKYGTTYEHNLDDYKNVPLQDETLYLNAKCYQHSYEIHKQYNLPVISGMALDCNGVLIPHVWNRLPNGRALDISWHTQTTYNKPRWYMGIEMRLSNVATAVNFMPFVMAYQYPEWIIRLYQFSHVIDHLTHGAAIERFWYRRHNKYLPSDEAIWQCSEFPMGKN